MLLQALCPPQTKAGHSWTVQHHVFYASGFVIVVNRRSPSLSRLYRYIYIYILRLFPSINPKCVLGDRDQSRLIGTSLYVCIYIYISIFRIPIMGWMTKTICRVSWPKRKRVCGCSPWFYFCSMSLLEEGGLGQWSRQIPVNGFDLLTQLTEGNLQKTGVPEFTAKEAMKKIELSLELGRPTSFLMFSSVLFV